MTFYGVGNKQLSRSGVNLQYSHFLGVYHSLPHNGVCVYVWKYVSMYFYSSLWCLKISFV